MVLHWGTEYFEKLLPDHLLSRIEETRVDPSIDALSSVPQIKADTGAVMYAIPMPVANRVSRAKVRKLLLNDGLDIKVGDLPRSSLDTTDRLCSSLAKSSSPFPSRAPGFRWHSTMALSSLATWSLAAMAPTLSFVSSW